MKPRPLNFRVELCTLIFMICVAVVPYMRAENIHLIATSKVASGWHPWYETKVDPEDSQNLLLCGTKWDAQTNAPFGFVYASSDQGKSWANVLEDRSSGWVTEQSCAFGTLHRAYFISEASKVIDGTAHHELGTTRLYVSRDAGHTWKESVQTGWADWSTSAVSVTSGRLFTFFNAYTRADPARKRGSSVGLLTFSPDGNAVSGPVLAPSVEKQNYQGAYPSDAIALKTGAIVALWYGTRLSPSGIETDLYVIRVSAAHPAVLESVNIARSNDNGSCIRFNQASLTYDPGRGRLFVLYMEGCEEKQIILVSSDDEGRTWSKRTPIAETKGLLEGFSHPSLAAEEDRLTVLWEAGDGSGSWFLSTIEGRTLVSTIQLSSTEDVQNVSSNSLLTSIERPASFSQPASPKSVQLNLRNEADAVWRANALLPVDGGILAVWPTDSGNGAGLWFGTISRTTSVQKPDASDIPKMREATEDIIILYGGTQHFDDSTSLLTVCVSVKNAGTRSLGIPIQLRAESMVSDAGPITATNASNRVAGAGAIWDISNSITGDRIPPQATSNPFCLTFRLNPELVAHHPADPKSLLDMRLRVFASEDSFAARERSEGTRPSN